MYVRLNKGVYIRQYCQYAFVFSNILEKTRVYGTDRWEFLRSIDKEGSTVETILSDVPTPDWDVLGFIQELEREGFISTGNSINELEEKDQPFSYEKTYPRCVLSNKEVFFYQTIMRMNPQIIECHIEVTNRCNEQCVHCYIPHEEKTVTLSSEDTFRVLDELAQMGNLHIILGGGEPLLHPEFFAIYEYAVKKGFRVILLTNLTQLKNTHVQLFRTFGIGYIQTSLYSMNPEIHDRITQLPGSQLQTVTAIKSLIHNNIQVKIFCPLLDINKNCFPEVFQWAKQQKCQARTDYTIIAQTNLNTTNLQHRIDLSAVEQTIQECICADSEYPMLRKEKNSKRRPNDPVCQAGTVSICLSASGDYYPCAGWQGYPVGSIKEKLSVVWERSSALTKLRNVKNSSFPDCILCQAQNYCSMCLVRNFNENDGNMFKKSVHTCKVAFVNKKLAEDNQTKKESLDQ